MLSCTFHFQDLGRSEIGTRLRAVVKQNVGVAGEDPGLSRYFSLD